MRRKPLRPLAERFAAKVERRGPDECWPWTGAIDPQTGYGRIQIGTTRDTKTDGAHRVAYEFAFGPIPPGMHIDHVASRGCVMRHCVNPKHLEAVTQAENNRRQFEAGGHPMARLTPEQVRAIRNSDEPCAVAARRYGVRREHIWAIRTGRAWRGVV